jgi:hypothetical protein
VALPAVEIVTRAAVERFAMLLKLASLRSRLSQRAAERTHQRRDKNVRAIVKFTNYPPETALHIAGPVPADARRLASSGPTSR